MTIRKTSEMQGCTNNCLWCWPFYNCIPVLSLCDFISDVTICTIRPLSDYLLEDRPGVHMFIDIFAEIKRLKSFLMKHTALPQIAEEGGIREGMEQDMLPV